MQLKSELIFGLKIYPFNNIDSIIEYISDKKGLLIALGAEKLLNKDERFRNIVNKNIGYCDGVGAVWALKKRGVIVPKIPGSVLWRKVIEKYFRTKKIYILGAKENVLKKTLIKLKNKYDLDLVGANNGYFDNNEYEAIKAEIVKKKPDIIFVALGSPKQEYVMDELFKLHPALYMGLGGSLNLYTGEVKDVPIWWKKVFKWEGLYRQFYDLSNTKRWKRQFRVLPIIWKILLGRI